MENELQKLHPIDYNLLTVQDLWQIRNQVLSIIALREYIKSNVETVICIVLTT